MSEPGSDGLPHAWLEHRLDAIETRISGHAQESRNNFAELRKDFVMIAVHTNQISQLGGDLKEVEAEVKVTTANANRIAGAGAVLAIVAGLIPWPWKR